MAAVVPLLAQHGPEVTTRQIAAAAGIAEGTIFRVFSDKRAMFLAVAEETANPRHGREDMAEALAPVPDLHGKIVVTVERLEHRMHQTMLVMMALRGALMSEPHPSTRTGPPAFLVEANEQLLRNLADLVFEPHREELRMQPLVAARVLRSLVFGMWHPGMHAEDALTPAQVADAVLDGVRAASEGVD